MADPLVHTCLEFVLEPEQVSLGLDNRDIKVDQVKKKQIIKSILNVGPVKSIELPSLLNYLKPEEVPHIDATPIGRHRLISALKNKFGIMYKNRPGVEGLIKEYDDKARIVKNTIKLGVK